MPQFDSKTWNDTVFQKYLQKVPNVKENALIKAGIFKVNNEIKSRMVDQVGGNYIVEPIKGLLDGDVLNYDGTTSFGEGDSRETYMQGKIAIGRMKNWQEKDFSTELTGVNWMKGVAGEVAEYYQSVDQHTLLQILAGIFAMSGDFATKHTYDISAEADNNTVGAGTLNKAIQKASGDKKGIYKAAFMHSEVATNLENLQLLEYVKYNDANGMERDLTMGTWNGRLVIVDDDMPVSDEGAYTTYVLGTDAFEYSNLGAKVPSEMSRDPKTNGGLDILYTRQRKLFAPKWISWKGSKTTSPKDTDLADGSNWEVVNNGKSGSGKKTVNDKAIPFVRIVSKG